jgi:SAM-dependent methyltransferase
MDEASKTKKIWTDFEKSLLLGTGIDIGCGSDPITPQVRRFDVENGDANHVTHFVREQFDFVFSSHCLEHMREPQNALLDWWQLVKPGGHLILIVPDEDLYEQGVFPSRFNFDHKSTFTISKARSWSPVSHNILDLVRSLPNSELISLQLQDHGYDRLLLRHGQIPAPNPLFLFVFRAYSALRRRRLFRFTSMESWMMRYHAVDQTRCPDVLAQIQCIVRKQD